MPRDIFRLAYDLRMSADTDATAEMMLYGEIIPDMRDEWKWSKEDKSAADLDREIKAVREKGATKLLLRINSPGGVCTEAVAMRSILVNAGFEEINIRIEGMCASAATDIATLPGAHVTISEGSEYMIHCPWCFAMGNANELEHTIERLRNIEQMSRGFYVSRTGQSEEQIKEWMDAETWFTAEQAVEYGFCDEVESVSETPAAACVTDRAMAIMKGLYKSVPENITVKEETPKVSNEAPTAGVSSEIKSHEQEEKAMEPKDITMEQLTAENPALLEQIRQAAVNEERQRLDDIDALTMPGYEEMAAKAKASGTSAMDFQKELVAAMKQKGNDFLQNRQQETAPAQNVAGGEPKASVKSEAEEIADNAKEIAEYAKNFTNMQTDGMF